MLVVEKPNGKRRTIHLKLGEGETGLEFETYLMDKQRSCANNCIFCFIDQLPKGLRESLYFKDDDSRLSFLFGNYITLTNIGERDIDRIIETEKELKTANGLHFVSSNSLAVFRVFVQYVSEASRFP